MRLNFYNIMIDYHEVAWLSCGQRYFVLYLNRNMVVNEILIQYNYFDFVLFMNCFCSKMHCCKIIRSRMLESRSEKIWSIPWLLMMFGLIGAQGREQLWLCICLASRSLASMSKYLTHWGRDKWPPFSRRHFQMDFLEWKCMNFDLHFTEICS